MAPDPCGASARPPLKSTTRAPTTTHFGAQSHDLGTRCLRFAGRVAPPPRKTRFRLLVRLYRTGLATRRVPTKGFEFLVSSSFPKLRGAMSDHFSAFRGRPRARSQASPRSAPWVPPSRAGRRGDHHATSPGPQPVPRRAARREPGIAIATGTAPGPSPRVLQSGRGVKRGSGRPSHGRQARPGIIVRVRDDPGAERIGLDITQDRPKMFILLDDGALEPALPDMADGAVAAMIAPGVGHRQRLKHAAHGHPRLGAQE